MPISFRAATTGSGTTTAPVTVPASVQPGDALLLIAGANLDAVLTVPTGWTPLGPQQQPAAGAVTARIWRRTATAGDAGSTIAVTNDGVVGVKAQTLLLAYAGTDPVDPLHLAAPLLHGSGLATHPTPKITTTLPGCEIVQVCVSKSSNAFTVTATPTGAEARALLIGAGGGHINSIAVSETAAQPGTWGGSSFTQDATSNSAITFTVALAPKTATQSLRPVIDVRSDSYTAVPVAEAGVAMATRIGEGARDDGTYLQTPPGPAGAVYETRLAAGWDPFVSTGHTWTVVLSTAAGATSSTCRVELVQDTTVVAAQTLTGIPATPTPYSYTLTPAETDAISDYSNLRLRFTWTAS